MHILNKLKKEVLAAKSERESSHSLEIRFDSIGSGFECTIDPYTSRDFGQKGHINKVGFGVFSSGTTYYVNPISDEDHEKYEKALELKDRANNPYGKEREKMLKVFKSEILKAADEFDKKIDSIMKKYGYTERSKY